MNGSAELPPDPLKIESAEQRELSVRAIFTGVALGLVFAIANLYLVLKLSITASASIPVAVLGIAFFALSRHFLGTAAGTTSEYTTVQTIGSVGESLAFTVGLAVPVFAVLHVPLQQWQVFLATCGGGLVGCLVLVPSRRAALQAVFPEGAACARIIKAATTRVRTVIRPMVQGVAAAAVYAVARPFTTLALPHVELDLSPELMGIGYLIETKAAMTLGCGGVAGTLLQANNLSLTETPNSFYFLAAGAIATSALLQIARYMMRPGNALQSMPGVDLGTRDLRPAVIWMVATTSLLIACGAVALPLGVPKLWVAAMLPLAAILSVIFVRFSAGVAGNIGSSANPISAVALVSAIAAAAATYALPASDSKRTIVLTIALVVATAATCAGMTAQVLKTSDLLQATPRRQEIGVIIGTITSSAGLALLLPYLHTASSKLGPSSEILRNIVERSTSQNIEWRWVVAGAVITFLLDAMGVSSLIFAVGMYLKMEIAVPIWAGGMVYWAIDRRIAKAPESERGELQQASSLFDSGLIAGGIIVGVLVSTVTHWLVPSFDDHSSMLTLLLFLVLGIVFVRFPTRVRFT